MTDDAATREFLSRLRVTPAGDDRFTGVCHPAWPGRAFGGQVAAKALQAAAATVDNPAMEPWSIHVYFHAPVASGEPATYTVERIKDGRTLASRRVEVLQGDHLRVVATVLMGLPGEGPAHRWEVPRVPLPEDVVPVDRLIHRTVAPDDADFAALGYPEASRVDLRVINPEPAAHAAPAGGEPAGYTMRRPAWMRVTVDLPDDALTAASVLCYLSDIILGTTALEPHGGRGGATGLQLGALELSLWFTRPAPMGHWLLFAFGTPFAGSGHALAQGVIHDADGDVVAMAVQNALMRWA